MKSDPIFNELGPEQLLEICTLLSFDPVIDTQPVILMNKLTASEKLSWLGRNRNAIEEKISSVASWGFGRTEKTYAEVVQDVAGRFGAALAPAASTTEIERALITKIWNDAVSKLTPAQTEELKQRAQEIAAKHGKKFGGDVASFAALSAAQMSGFGVYLLGSTLLGAINGALGLGLGFGAFAGLSSLISTVIGPVGWATLGVSALMKLASPNYKKLLPVVIFIAANRALSQPDPVPNPSRGSSPEKIVLPPGAAVASKKFIAEFECDVAHTTVEAQASKKEERKKNPPKPRIVSKHERNLFNLKPENKMIRDIARDELGEHFLDLSDEYQEEVRRMAEVRRMTELPENIAALSMKDAEPQTLQGQPAKAAIVEPDDRSATEHTRRKWRKQLEEDRPNLRFSDKALDRFAYFFKNGDLHASFAKEFRLLNQGIVADKHHIPGTDPKIFQRDCGHSGRVYYRRGNETNLVYIELVGDKNSQDRDLAALRALPRQAH
ncbi:MAG: hypothetical protein ACYDBH_16980 [Acidobacteriaceae bacterium]